MTRKATASDNNMPIQTQSADGVLHEFPDETPADVVDRAMKSYAQREQSLPWTQVGVEAIHNIPSSAGRFLSDIAQPFVHPIETATNLKNIGQGALEYAGLLSGNEHERYLDAVGQYLVDRYGGVENLKRTIASDPIGFAGDVSMILSGGETALARAPGVVGRVGEIAGSVGRAVNPLAVPGRVAQGVGYGASELIGLTTGVGGEAIRTAAAAGRAGGEAGLAFREQMRGQAPMEAVVEDAREAVRQMRVQRSEAYRGGMADVVSDQTTILDFSKIDAAVQAADRVKAYKGQSLSPTTQAIRDQLRQTIEEWRALPAQDFHTVEGLDALKQKIGDVRDGTKFGTPERVAADRVYQGIRRTIIEQSPDYAKIMNAYEIASNEIREIEKELSLNPNASIGTPLRKLQSILRNNVSTAYSNRRTLAEYLVNAGAPHLMEALAGQALSAPTARGFGTITTGLVAGLAFEIFGGSLGHPGVGVGAAAMLPAMSPRLMGEAAYAAGAAARPFGQAAQAAPQAVRRIPSVTIPYVPPAARLGDLLSNANGGQR
jgi:hypothetical protein